MQITYPIQTELLFPPMSEAEHKDYTKCLENEIARRLHKEALEEFAPVSLSTTVVTGPH